MKVIAFGATNSRNSINKQLATYAAQQIQGADIDVLDLNDYEMPLFSVDREADIGQPQLAKDFLAKIDEADLVIIAFAEHNGSYTAAYKNLFDWASRVRMKVYENKNVIMLSTSPGPGGANSVLTAATGSAPYFGVNLIGSLSVPSFFDTFDAEHGEFRDAELKAKLAAIIAEVEQP
ncbi:NADPH-dependent FMN reductase [Thaumasiovibrio subtropicus]|uniref:NADPH-dependent FMN reductase n=1 Tax=Thaumasiovibrio subtropicus TaxID=1891207 RepID=UPI000B35BC32|nr:NADPH-dependent FMN reductase [Thaumasiovibrio subtropicus]